MTHYIYFYGNDDEMKIKTIMSKRNKIMSKIYKINYKGRIGMWIQGSKTWKETIRTEFE
jgi:hypothetical protein